MRSVIKLSLFSYLLLIVFTLCIVVYPCASIASERFPSFTSSEKQWIQKNPIVKFSIHEKYRHYWTSGFYPNLLAKLKECSGLDFEPVWRNSDKSILEEFKSKQIQFIIDPDISSSVIDMGFVSDPIFWGHDVAVKKSINSDRSEVGSHNVIYFDRGYDLGKTNPDVLKNSSSDVLIKKLIHGEAQLVIMPLRLTRALGQTISLYGLEVKPWGNQPFAYRWLISNHDQILNSIIKKSIDAIDPMVLGTLLSTPGLGTLETQTDSMDKNTFSIMSGFGIGLILLILWAGHHYLYRKKFAQKEATLIAIADKAILASAAKSDYLATMSHEIRTPMHAVIGVQELLLKRVDLNPEQKDLVESANTSSQSLMGIMNNVLDISKIEAGKYTLEPQPTDLKKLLYEINQTFSIFAQNKGVHLDVFIDSSIADVLLIDPIRLRQVIQNLLSNAIKFSGDSAVFFDVRILANDHAGQLIEFRIIDRGVGMTQEDIERALKPYEQVGSHCSTTLTSTPGTGLGLSICNHAIGLMQSQLNIESAPNLGTNVHFVTAFSRTGLELPQVMQAPVGNHLLIGNKTRTLIVEDHPASRKTLFIQLHTLGIFADQCSNGDEALCMLQKNKYDLVLTDHAMPGMHGFELVKKIRAMGHHELIIIGVTADIYAHQSRESSLKLGMDAVLIKPISLEVLERNIFNLLGEKAITKKVNNFCFDTDVRILILEEVLKVQYEVLHLIESNVCLLDEHKLNSLLHKVKGGALLSQAENLHQCCSELEQSNQVNSERIALFREAILINNADLESQLHQLKLL